MECRSYLISVHFATGLALHEWPPQLRFLKFQMLLTAGPTYRFRVPTVEAGSSTAGVAAFRTRGVSRLNCRILYSNAL